MPINNPLSDCLNKFQHLTTAPENYLSIQDDLSKSARELTKLIYDFTKVEEKLTTASNALPELIIDEFDEEQIWQEIELQNEETWTSTLANVSKLLSNKNNLEIPVKVENGSARDVANFQQASSDENNYSGDENDEEDEENDEDNDDDDEEDITNSLKEISKADSRTKKTYKSSIVDDTFFKLREMEEFLDAEDKNEMQKSRKKKHVSESSEDEDEDVDLFEGWESAEDSDDDMESDPINYKYGDFFETVSDEKQEKVKKINGVPHNDEDDSEQNFEEKTPGTKKRVSFNLSQPSSDDDVDDSEPENGEVSENEDRTNESSKIEDLSEFQKRQERLNKKIAHLENNLLQEKVWPMKGEVNAAGRPQNSLLEEVVDFDMTSRPAPIITEETTMKLQDIIIQRIKDKTWDDVIRKAKPVQEIQEFKKQLVLDQEKSKLSLAQVYEQQYIKQREALNPDDDDKPEEVPPAHVEISKSLSKLFSKLDALCNFHYTPRVAVPEVKIVSNMPAIAMEEAAPVATSDATLLAPEEIKAKLKGDVIGKSERTDTDKKRERRKKKIAQREKEKEKQKREKLVDKLRPGLGNKYSKEKMAKLLDKVTKDRNVDKMDISHDKKSLTSSTAFFNRLQDEVADSIRAKTKNTKTKAKKGFSAKQFKL